MDGITCMSSCLIQRLSEEEENKDVVNKMLCIFAASTDRSSNQFSIEVSLSESVVCLLAPAAGVGGR